MKYKMLLLISLSVMPIITNGQNITNTLGTSGVFTIKDGSTNYLTLSQSTGFLLLNRSLTIPNTTSSTTGIIFKGVDRFMHNYQAPTTIGYNTFLGIHAGNFTMSGYDWECSKNTGIGYYSLASLTSGYENTAVGRWSLGSNTIGYANTALGNSALSSNSSGSKNTAVGNYSLDNNSTGEENTALGVWSSSSNSTGNFNTAVGVGSLVDNFTGNQNTAVGWGSLLRNKVSENTAVGYRSLYSNTTNSGNTAVGWNSLYSSTGWNNTAVGHHSLNSNTTGNYNTALGYNAGSTITTGSNLTCIGIDAAPLLPTSIDQVTLGNGFVSSLRCNVQTITSLSDARDKKNITELSLGLDFITKLKPRQFNWDKREWYDGNISDGSKMKEDPTAGFIAQELDEAQTTGNAEWLNLVLKDNPEKWEATPGNLFPVLVKAVQELAIKNEELTIKNEKLEIRNEQLKIEKDEEVAELKTRLVKYEEMQVILAKKIEQIESNEQLFKVQIVTAENNNQ